MELMELFGVKENSLVPKKLKEIILTEEINEVYEKYIENFGDLESDDLNQNFQEVFSDRKNLKQDFTPNGLASLISKIVGEGETLDVCGGTGTLTINHYNENKNSSYTVEEFSDQAIPFLLFNLGIRGMDATVKHMDVLTNEVMNVYKTSNNGKYSKIKLEEPAGETNYLEKGKFQNCIMNPPYSLKWSGSMDERFFGYPLPPKSKADYAFILHGLYQLKEEGTLLAVLPHGILFRGGKEGEVRKQLIQENLIDSIIGLPDKMFFNTSIPVVLIILKKNRENKEILFIDASKEFVKNGKINTLNKEQEEKILTVYKHRMEVKRYSSVVDFTELEENNFNLNIPRYVSTFIPEPTPNLGETIKKLMENEKEIDENNANILKSIEDMTTENPEAKEELELFKKYLKKEF